MTLQGLGHTPLFISRTVCVFCVCYVVQYCMRLLVTPAPIYVWQWGHLYLYRGCLPWTGVYGGAWHAPSVASTCYTCYVLSVCIVVLGVHLLLLVFAALVICVSCTVCMWCLEHTGCC